MEMNRPGKDLNVISASMTFNENEIESAKRGHSF